MMSNDVDDMPKNCGFDSWVSRHLKNMNQWMYEFKEVLGSTPYRTALSINEDRIQGIGKIKVCQNIDGNLLSRCFKTLAAPQNVYKLGDSDIGK